MDLFDRNNPKTSGTDANLPLPERMRPGNITEFVGQIHLVGQGKPLRKILDNGLQNSIIFWGPPGSGKTTLARMIAVKSKAHFVEYSAVLSGIKQIKEVVKYAQYLQSQKNIPTILFIDEIHRFNKAQQDAFLPHVENGTIMLLGATTENPSFEVIPALLSRVRVFTLEPLSIENLTQLINRALENPNLLPQGTTADLEKDAVDLIAHHASGDARVALGALEFVLSLAETNEDGNIQITAAMIADSLQKHTVIYDKSGEHHFNLISAFHKSLRGSDTQAALYWLARMLEGGEDPRYIARRMIRFASEDIGLADPNALGMAVSAKDAYHFLGSPEGELALVECAVYLATAPKSNRLYTAFKKAGDAARETSHLPTPLSVRNAPTQLMKEMGYGKGYQYDHDTEDGFSGQAFLPPEICDSVFYTPGRFGFEKDIAKRIAWWTSRKSQRSSDNETNQ
jgi:putative ATPase